jgi:hypothetical protein
MSDGIIIMLFLLAMVAAAAFGVFLYGWMGRNQ